jgi:PPOX class probable F420-dependent enzyme
MAEIPDEARHLFEGTNGAHLATVNADGSPQTTPIWIGLEDDTVVFNTAKGRIKHRNMLRDPRVAVSIHSQENPYEMIAVQGTAEVLAEGGMEHINSLSSRYLGQDQYPFLQPGEARVIVRLTPEKVAYTPAA